MNKAVLDTDTLSALMRKNPDAVANAQAYLASHQQLTISLITRYEILRGLTAKNATQQIAAFDTLCRSLEVLPITDSVVVRAAKVYGALRQSGRLIGDADILIAATCLESGLELVTNNVSHFARVSGLTVHNWLSP